MRKLTLLLASALVFTGAANAQVGGVVQDTTGTVQETTQLPGQTLPGTIDRTSQGVLPRGASRLDQIAEQRARRAERAAAREAQADLDATAQSSAVTEIQAESADRTADILLQNQNDAAARLETSRAAAEAGAQTRSLGDASIAPGEDDIAASNAVDASARIDVAPPSVDPVLNRARDTVADINETLNDTNQLATDTIATVNSAAPEATLPGEVIVETPNVQANVAVPAASTTVIAPGSPGYIAPRGAGSSRVIYDTQGRAIDSGPVEQDPANDNNQGVVVTTPAAQPAVDSSRSAALNLSGTGTFNWLPLLIGALLILLLLFGARRASRRDFHA